MWKHNKLSIKVVEITQKQVEEWSALLPVVEDVTISQWRGDVVRAAVETGWFEGDPLDVDNMSPADVVWLSDKLAEHYKEITEVSPS